MQASSPFAIRQGGLDDPRVIALLEHHVASAAAETAPGSAHAFNVEKLKDSRVRFWSLWEGDALIGTGALYRMEYEHGEVKSMHTVREARGRGAGSAMLAHIIAAARAQGMKRLSLETGSWDYFRPAWALYARHGFEECGPFGSYQLDPNSKFMTLEL
jgi:putative acetyltransferase